MFGLFTKTLTALVALSVLSGAAAAGDRTRLDNRLKLVQPLKRTTPGALQARTERALRPGLAATTTFGAPSNPDLVIIPRFAVGIGLPNTGYCGPWNGGNQSVYFYVKNIGQTTAAASHVQIAYLEPYASVLPVPQLTPNQQVLLSHPIPVGAWGPGSHPSAHFLVSADQYDEVDEQNVTNNYGEGTCLGPAS